MDVVASGYVVMGLVEELIEGCLLACVFADDLYALLEQGECLLLISLIDALRSLIGQPAILQQILVSLVEISLALMQFDFFFEFNEGLG